MNIFYGKFCNKLTEEQLYSLEQLGDYESPEECLNTLNSCGMSLEDLLNSYPAFFSPEVLPVSEGDKVIFIENDWYEIELYQAINSITDTESLFNKENWNIVCSVKNTKPPKYQDFETIWPLYTPLQSYTEGDIVFKMGECGDSACAYIALTNITNSSGIDNNWKKIFCISTDKYTCGNYKRKKTPEQGYRLIKVDHGQYDFVEHPIPYKEYIGNIFKNCGPNTKPFNECEPLVIPLAVWMEGNLSGEFEQSNIYSKVLPSSETAPNLISENNPNPEDFQVYSNKRPAINKLDEESLIVTWEYFYSFTGKFQGKTFTIDYGGELGD